MDLHIEIDNFKGNAVANLIIKQGQIALLAGNNGASKTSIITAVQMLVTRDLPTPKRIPSLIRTGASQAKAKLTTEDSFISVTLPSRSKDEDGDPPKLSAYSAGKVDFTRLDLDKRALELQKLIKGEPSQQDLEKHLAKKEFTAEQVIPVWQKIEQYGWDKTHKFFAERGQKLVGQWRQVAGENWGSDKSKPEKYLPANWDASLEKASEEELQKRLADERDTLESLIRHSAASEQELNQLNEVWLGKEYAQGAMLEAQSKVTEYEAELREQTEKLKNLPRPGSAQKTVACPHCNEQVAIVGNNLEKPSEVTAEQIETKKKAWENQNSVCTELSKKLNAAHNEAGKWQAEVKKCENAYTRIQEIAEQQKATEQKATEQDIENQRTVIEKLQLRIKAHKTKREADDIHLQIVRNQHVIDALAPDGLRLKKLSDQLSEFNEALEELWTAANFVPIRIDSDMEITYGGRLYDDISEGEQMRVDKVFQLAIARYENAPFIISDRTEVLDEAGRSGFIIMIKQLGLSALLGLRIKKESVPNLAAAGLGQSYWLEDGVAKPLVKEVAA